MANSFTFNGTDLGGASYNLTVTSGVTSIFPEQEIDFVKVLGRDGVLRNDGTWGPRLLNVSCEVSGASYADVLTKLENVQQVLGVRSAQQIIFDSAYQNDRYFLGSLKSPVNANSAGSQLITFDLEFFCADPFAYSTTDESESISLTDGNTINTPTILGNAPAFGVWTLDHSGGGSSWTLENTTSGVGTSLVKSQAFLSSYDHKITSISELVQVSISGGAYSDSMDGISGSFPWLKPGVNSLKLSGSAATLTLDYTPRYF